MQLRDLDNLAGVKTFLEDKVWNKVSKVYLLLAIVTIFSLVSLDQIFTVVIGLLLSDLLISKWMARSGPPGIGLETASLATIIAGFKISPTVGGFIGGIAVFLRIGVGLSGAFIIWKIPGFILLGLLSGSLIGSIVPGGIFLLGAVRTAFIFASNFMQKKSIAPKITFSVTNVILVYFLTNRLIELGIL